MTRFSLSIWIGLYIILHFYLYLQQLFKLINYTIILKKYLIIDNLLLKTVCIITYSSYLLIYRILTRRRRAGTAIIELQALKMKNFISVFLLIILTALIFNCKDKKKPDWIDMRAVQPDGSFDDKFIFKKEIEKEQRRSNKYKKGDFD